MKEIVLVLSIVCGMSDPQIPESQKTDCIDYVLNCTITGKSAGEYTEEQLDKCVQNWKKGARYKEP